MRPAVLWFCLGGEESYDNKLSDTWEYAGLS